MSNLVQMPERRPINQRVGMNVGLILMMRGKTQAELAAVLHVTQASASRRIAGISPWTPDELAATADFLDVQIGRLFEELPSLDSVGPAGIEPTTSTVESQRLASVTAITGERVA